MAASSDLSVLWKLSLHGNEWLFFLSVLSVSHFALFSFQPKKFFINMSFTCLDIHLSSREVGLIVLVNLGVSCPE